MTYFMNPLENELWGCNKDKIIDLRFKLEIYKPEVKHLEAQVAPSWPMLEISTRFKKSGLRKTWNF